jgi:hypothetical protein
MTSRDGRPQPHASWFVRPNGFDAAHTIHGLSHTRRVLIHATAIADELELSPLEREAIEFAACWHDIGRTNDGVDYYHGAKSAGKAVALGLHDGLDPRVRELALYAITHHCGSEDHGGRAAFSVGYHEHVGAEDWVWHPIDPDSALWVFRVLKDADGLDRVRLGDLKVKYLRTDPARGMLDRAEQLLLEIP